ncbi:autophagy protein Atg27 [Drepanopeziza brunnea f. sp. 'multigermtubi' MB_m1]|uniref:Autophagy-related protein 27 n=1 Tax=Marssonina brunnea f. sp. multigermtubi (strain MB_m1) TaxID=1072389 RepID=K1X3D3_MARBU|nr:autophagy protein Atg27 [Drepanopeziza brunnea f. sp. 'multigermtubi' MB_m1]EKD19532.1 autophagy protein Atg27 [Drepanopeziza brunnea f. sp. 'multigermtubi' MB_m1]
MRLPRSSADATVLSALLFPTLAAATGNFDCTKIVIDKTHQWDLSTLGGPRSVMHSEDRGASWKNTTYTIDICKPLKRAGKDACPGNTRVCGIEHDINKDTNSSIIGEVIPIAGDLKEKGGGDLDAKWVRLETDGSHADSEKQGLRLTMNGGFAPGSNKKQKAIVEFECDLNRSGLENLWESEDKYESRKAKRAEGEEKRDDPKDGGDTNEDDAKSPDLQFVRYDTSGETEDVLRLHWKTKYACENVKDDDGDSKKTAGWGFFTWFIIIAFLSTATYLIFGSWLNYNRYGARGWDLLPHGDTIRDIPYLFKDWMRRVLNTVQGGGSRGGYAAV